VRAAVNVIKIYPPKDAAPVVKAIINPVRKRLKARQALRVKHSNAKSAPNRQSRYDSE
jgi:hypothetical protein